MGFFGDIYVFLSLSGKDIFGRQRANLYIEKPMCSEYSFQKQTQYSQGKNVLDASASNIWFSFERYMCFFKLAG
jgi:hypothetical protein